MWFRKDKQTHEQRMQPILDKHNTAVEIVAHKNATIEAKKDIDDANAKLKDIFDKNHFTIKIYLANGNKRKIQRATK